MSNGNQTITQITPDGSTAITFSNSVLFTEIIGLAFDSSYNLYVANGNTNSILRSDVPACFNYDTKILCFNQLIVNEEYLPIQNLKCGDFVKVYSSNDNNNYKKIKYIGKKSLLNRNTKLGGLYIYKQNNSFEDLIITGGHSILVDELTDEQKRNELQFRPITKIDDKYLLLSCNSEKFEKINNNDNYTYYHIVLENDDDNGNYGVWANGVLTESISEKYFLKHEFEIM